MKDRKFLKIAFFVSVYVMVAILLSFLLRDQNRKTVQQQPQVITYEIAQMSDVFKLLWEKSIEMRSGSDSLVAGEKDAFLITTNIRYAPVVRIDLLTGEPARYYLLARNTGEMGPRIATLVVNGNMLVAQFHSTQKISDNTTWGAAEIMAIDLQSGLLWTQPIRGTHGADLIVLTDDTVSVDGSGDNDFLFDLDSGRIIEDREKSGHNYTLALEDQIAYETLRGGFIRVVNRETNATIWTSEFIAYTFYQAVFTDELIILGSSNSGVLGLNKANGEVLWEIEDILSNFVVSESAVFFMTNDMELVAVDVQSGEVVGKITFSQQEVENDFKNQIQVAANDDTVLVYLGDGQQLMAFRYGFGERDTAVNFQPSFLFLQIPPAFRPSVFTIKEIKKP